MELGIEIKIIMMVAQLDYKPSQNILSRRKFAISSWSNIVKIFLKPATPSVDLYEIKFFFQSRDISLHEKVALREAGAGSNNSTLTCNPDIINK